MNKRVDTIIEEARKLTLEERVDLMRKLRQLGRNSRTTRSGTGRDSAAAEARQRADQVDRGEVELVPWEEVLAELRKG